MPTAPDSIIALLRKIKTLRDRGVEGERLAAEADLLAPAEATDHAFIAVGQDEVTTN